jgi:hypothetical protein
MDGLLALLTALKNVNSFTLIIIIIIIICFINFHYILLTYRSRVWAERAQSV